MTLPSVKLDCDGCFSSGMIGVGLSRVKSPDHITVLNFNRLLCPPQPPQIAEFYKSLEEVPSTQTCCKQVYTPREPPFMPALAEIDEYEDEMDALDDTEEVRCVAELDITPLTNEHLDEYPAEVTYENLLTKLIIPGASSKFQCEEVHNDAVNAASQDNILNFGKTLYAKLYNLAEAKLKPQQTEIGQRTRVKRINTVVNLFSNKLMKSDEYSTLIKACFGSCSKTHRIIANQILMKIQDIYFSIYAQNFFSLKDNPLYNLASQDCKLRYVSGMT